MTNNNSQTFDILSDNPSDTLLSVSEDTQFQQLERFVQAKMQDVSDTDSSNYLSIELISAYGQKVIEKLERHLEANLNHDLFNALFITSGWEHKFYRSHILFSPTQ